MLATMLPSRKLVRLFWVSVAIVLLIWLYRSSAGNVLRGNDLQTQISTGLVGKLDPHFSETLTQEFQELAAASGAPLPEIVLNKYPQPNKLVVLVTSPKAEHTTGCGRGNAVYDPSLDVIFIDADALTPILNKSPYGTPLVARSIVDDPVARAYRDFLFLHELGHRVLHRSKTRIYDQLTEPKSLEDEADAFAMRTMARFFKEYNPPILPPTEGGTRFKLPMAVTGEDGAFVVLGQMVYEINQGFLFSDLRQSPYSIDRAHRRFIDRAKNLLASASRLTTKPELLSYIELAQEYCSRIAASAPMIAAEINTPGIVEDVDFDQSALFLLSNDNRLFRIPYSSLNLTHDNAPASFAVSLDLLICSPPLKGLFPAHDGAKTLIAAEDMTRVQLWVQGLGIFRCNQGEWKIDEHWNNFHSDRWSYIELNHNSPGQFVAATEDRQNNEWTFELYDRGQRIASKSSTQLAQETYNRGLPSSCLNPSTQLTSDLQAIIVSCGVPRRIAFCELDLKSLSPTNCRLTESGSDAEAALDQGTLITIGPNDHKKLYAVQAIFDPYAPHTTRYEFRVVQLDDLAHAKTVARHDLVLEKLPYNVSPFDWLTVSHPPVVYCALVRPDGIACSLFQDSSYFFDSSTNSLNPFFHPAGAMLRTSRSGWLVVANGWKVYVLDPKHSKLENFQ